jgi:hypothetical protein
MGILLNFRNLKTKRQMKHAILDLFHLKKISTFWFNDENGVLSIRVSASRGKVFLKVNLPHEFKTADPVRTRCGFGRAFDVTETYNTIINRPSNEELERLTAKGQRLYYCPDVDGHISTALLLGWLKVFPDAVVTVTPESKPKHILLKSEFGCAFIHVSRKEK